MVDKYFTDNYSKLISIAYFLSSKQAEDLLHDTYIAMKSREGHIRNNTHYFNRTIRNIAKKYYNKDDREYIEDVEVYDDTTDIEVLELIERLDLSEKEKETLELLLTGYTRGEIAEIRGEKYKTIQSRIYRIGKKI